jgi:hypothetical protein
MEPTGRSAGRSGGGAGATGASGAADATGALQRPSAPTRSSGATGPRGLSCTFWSPPVAFAQLGVAKTFIGLENKPPSLVSGSRRIELVQPATLRANPAQHTNAILEAVQRRKTKVPRAINPLVR